MKRLLFIFSLCLLCSSCSVWLADVTPSSTHCEHYHRPVPPPPPPQPHYHNPPKSVHKPSRHKPSGVKPRTQHPQTQPSAPKPNKSRPQSSGQSRNQHHR